MELRTIETFLKVASLQNLSKAAEQLGYSQSAVTVQIQKLEKELELPLFERIGKRVFLTEKGKEFIPYANNIMRASQEALEFSREEEASPRGKLRIGGVESVCTALLPELLLEFYRKCPAVEVVIRSGPTGELIQLMESNELDLVLTLDERIHRPELKRVVDRQEEIIFVASPRQLTAGHAPVSLPELCRQPFILTETGAAYRYELEQMLSDRELEIQPILEIGNTETIIKLLKRGVGVSFLPRFTVEEELQTGMLCQIPTELPPVQMYHQLFFHQSKLVTKQMSIFIGLVQSCFDHRDRG